MNKKRQVSLAVVMVVFGMGLILAAFIVPPTGYIDPTVLTAFGEMLTFAGSLIGIDYHYKFKNYEKNKLHNHSLLGDQANADE